MGIFRTLLRRLLNIKGEEVATVAFGANGAVFAEVLKQAPDLDAVSLPLPSFWRRGRVELIARYRAVRRIAILGADYEREQMAFKGEVRSKRGTYHKWWHAAFWYGLAYDTLSDFGRSMSRPVLAWLISIASFALIYLHSFLFQDRDRLSPANFRPAFSHLTFPNIYSLNRKIVFINMQIYR